MFDLLHILLYNLIYSTVWFYELIKCLFVKCFSVMSRKLTALTTFFAPSDATLNFILWLHSCHLWKKNNLTLYNTVVLICPTEGAWHSKNSESSSIFNHLRRSIQAPPASFGFDQSVSVSGSAPSRSRLICRTDMRGVVQSEQLCSSPRSAQATNWCFRRLSASSLRGKFNWL